MAISRILSATTANEFSIAVTGAYTSVTLPKEYPAGSYTLTSAVGDSSFDIYAFNSNGQLSAYTKTASFNPTVGFIKIVILGGTIGDLFSFVYKETFSSIDDSDEVTAGPVATSVSQPSLPNLNDTFILTGRNFAANATVTFSSANVAYTPALAKNVVRNSETSLTVTRPDLFPANFAPYTITVQNPGVVNPTGSNSHILSNAITAGSGPTWVTGSTLSYTAGSPYDGDNLSATDPDNGGAITYSIVSGTLPTGLSLSSSGVISGTTSNSQVSVTFRATDSANSYTDKTIKFNARPVWSTTAGTLPTTGVIGDAYSYSLSATDDNGAITYAVTSGTITPGLSLSSSGVISGTPTTYDPNANTTFTVTATDSEGGTKTRTFGIIIRQYSYATITSSQTWTAPSSQTVNYLIVAGGGSGGSRSSDWPGNGGGGAGGLLFGTVSVTSGTGYPITIGGGGNSVSGNATGNDGGSTSAFGLTASGGGGGGSPTGPNYLGRNGGSGGGGTYSYSGGSGVSGQGNAGGNGNNGNPGSGGGGGGKSSAGNTYSNPTGGSGYTWLDGNSYAGGGAGGGADNNQNDTWSGGSGGGGNTGSSATYFGGGGGAGKRGNSSGSGYQGIVKIRYIG